MSGVIIEGVCATGKSSVLRSLLSSPLFAQRDSLSLVCISEHHTQRVLEPLEKSGDLKVEDNLGLLSNIVDFLQDLNSRTAKHSWAERGKIAHRIDFILERFHLTHVMHYSHMAWADVADIDLCLAGLNAGLVILKCDRDALAGRLFDSGRDNGWFEYLKTIGSDRESVVDHYLQQQEYLLSLSEKSVLPKLVIDTSFLSPEESAENVIDYLKQTG